MPTAKKRQKVTAAPQLASAEAQLVSDGVLDIDEAAEVIPFNYAITAYGADPQVDGLIKRLMSGDISIPRFRIPSSGEDSVRFQREYVWSKLQADRFIESLLLGLPVPGSARRAECCDSRCLKV
jgi:hypothetical protein